jgi:hypothetical protein
MTIVTTRFKPISLGAYLCNIGWIATAEISNRVIQLASAVITPAIVVNAIENTVVRRILVKSVSRMYSQILSE